MAGRFNWKAEWDTQNHYAMEEGSGTSTADKGPLGHDATFQATPTWVTGVVGSSALSFDQGTSDHCTAAAAVPPTQLTVSLWAKFDSISVVSRMFAWENGTEGQTFYYNHDNDTLNMITYVSSYGSYVHSTADVSAIVTATGVWHHLLYTQDGPTAHGVFYVNGTLLATTEETSSGSTTRASATKYISDDGGQAMDGSLDDIRVFDRILSVPEILYLNSLGAT